MVSNKHSRLNKFEKRRKTTKSLSLLLILGGILIILLLCIWFFGGGEDNEDQTSEDPNKTESSSDVSINDDSKDEDDSGDEVTKGDENSSDKDDDEDKEKQDDEDKDEDKDKDKNKDEDKDDEDKIEKEEAEPSDDNVSEAYTADWKAVGTDQEGEHTTNYENGSQDRNEIQKATAMATGLDESSIVTIWVGNDGDQKVVSTVTNADKTENYRVFLSWNDGEGWQPTKVEKLKSLDY